MRKKTWWFLTLTVMCVDWTAGFSRFSRGEVLLILNSKSFSSCITKKPIKIHMIWLMPHFMIFSIFVSQSKGHLTFQNKNKKWRFYLFIYIYIYICDYSHSYKFPKRNNIKMKLWSSLNLAYFYFLFIFTYEWVNKKEDLLAFDFDSDVRWLNNWLF